MPPSVCGPYKRAHVRSCVTTILLSLRILLLAFVADRARSPLLSSRLLKACCCAQLLLRRVASRTPQRSEAVKRRDSVARFVLQTFHACL